MTYSKKPKLKSKRGSALLISFAVMMILAVAGISYLNSATVNVRISKRQTLAVMTSDLCEAGSQQLKWALWRPFKINQDFATMDANCDGASLSTPTASQSGSISGVGRFSAAVISYTHTSSYQRDMVIRTVGFIDSDGDGVLDAGEPRRVVDVSVTYSLQRSAVFDYTYFVNNYGWFKGFSPTSMVVNGDMRANGNFDFTNGLPTVNGSVIASQNEKLSPAAPGLVNTAPVKMSNSDYASLAASNPRMRQGYDSTIHGAKGSNQYESWRDVVFESNATMVNGRADGAEIWDSTGSDSWVNPSGTATTSTLDSTPSKELIMPDLNDLTKYQTISNSYSDTRATFGDGTANPDFGVGAYVKTWNSSTNAYTTVSTNGVVSGSTMLIGTPTHPIKIHGPVTVTQDAVIKGTVQGQGTIYAGRNVHIVGSIMYSSGPDFRGSNATTIDNSNSKKDVLALCARGSVIMGSPGSFDSGTLQYMTPPFTKGRYDEQGNWIAPFDATSRDSTGFYKYQSVYGDSALANVASSIDQLDAVVYTNYLGGGQLATGGNGMMFNGCIISRDEAMVIYSLPMTMNYDQRIKERTLSQKPLIDINLPRSPNVAQNTWQDRGFSADGY